MTDQEQTRVAVTSDDAGSYGLEARTEGNEVVVRRYSRHAKGDESTTEIRLDQRFAPLLAYALQALGDGREFTPLPEQHPNERDVLVCPTCGHNGVFDGQGADSEGRYISRCAECDTTIHQPENPKYANPL